MIPLSRARDVVIEAFTQSVDAVIAERAGNRITVEMDYRVDGDPLVRVIEAAILVCQSDYRSLIGASNVQRLRDALALTGVPDGEMR